MKRKIKLKSKSNSKFKIYIILGIISFSFVLNLLCKDDNFKDYLFNALLNETTNKVTMLEENIKDYLSPTNIIYSSLNKNVNKNELSVFMDTEEDLYDYSNKNTDYIEDPNPIKIEKPIVYIYNSHQLEEYNTESTMEYSVKPNVMIASYIIKEKLNELGIPSIVETSNIKEYLNNNNLKYSYSYVASRHFIEKALNENPTLTYLIDIHRDSATKNITYLEYNGMKYARVLFVVGMDHENHLLNLSMAEKLHNSIELKVPGISRGISKKTGSKVNGIYNQDISGNAMLIEVGGVDNVLEEVYNTSNLIAEILSEYIGG